MYLAFFGNLLYNEPCAISGLEPEQQQEVIEYVKQHLKRPDALWDCPYSRLLVIVLQLVATFVKIGTFP